MALKKESLIKKITDNLAFYSKSISIKNTISLFDSNRTAQEFFIGILSPIFGCEDLKELDKLNDISNYPAIDLGDEKKKIAFQITTDNSSQKIKHTIELFLKHQLYNTYDRLIVLIIWNKQNSYSLKFTAKQNISFDVSKNEFRLDSESKWIVFDKSQDIWDDNTLIKEIDKLDIPLLESLQSFLEVNLEPFYAPETLFDADIKKCIEILKRDCGSAESIRDNLMRKNDNFMEEKNKVNNVSVDFFKEKILGHLSYSKDIFSFLKNEINKEVRNDYLEVTQSIQNFYKDKTNGFSSFEEVFVAIFNKINTYNDDVSWVSIKLKIILHNMYFNCDIGNNPDETA